MDLIVRRKPGFLPHQALIHTPLGVFPCIVGKGGITAQKREGDGATPIGSFNSLFGYFRQDRFMRPNSQLPMQAISDKDGWCDEPNHPAYNCPVVLPFAASHEKMRRDDRLYDVCLVMDYNISKRIRGMGSAIFFHLTSEAGKPTQGCVAIDPTLMRRLLPFLSTKTRMRIILG